MESGMIDDYVDRKHGRKAVAYLVPQLAPSLKKPTASSSIRNRS